MADFVPLLQQISDPGTPACRNCRFWWRLPDQARFPESSCRLLPPKDGDGRRSSDFPKTRYDTWCGQHQPDSA